MDLPSKKKDRSHDTNIVHIEKLSSSDKKYTHLLLGDSLLDNFSKNSGKVYYDLLQQKVALFNAGVGGDRVENVLYRLIDGKLLDHPNIKTVTNVYLLIGTNNLDNKKPKCANIIHSGIMTIAKQLVQNLPNLKNIYVFQIPPRADINKNIIDAANTPIREYFNTKPTINQVQIKYIEWSNVFSNGSGINPAYYFDHVHFSSAGYEILYNKMLELL